MKIVKQSLLHYKKGSSNKLYNVYLLDSGSGKFLVNFEYGRFGSNLRTGTKTENPKSFEEATKIFDSLVKSKIKKGYLLKDGFNPISEKERRKRDNITKEEYQKWLILKLQKAKRDSLTEIDNYKLSKLIYKVGEIKLKDAKNLVVSIYEDGFDKSNIFLYSVAFTLGRIGDEGDLVILRDILDQLELESKYIAKEAIRKIKRDKIIKRDMDMNNEVLTIALRAFEEIESKLPPQLLDEAQDAVGNIKRIMEESDSSYNQTIENIAKTISEEINELERFRIENSYQIFCDTDSWWFKSMTRDRRNSILSVKRLFSKKKSALGDTLLKLYANDDDKARKMLVNFIDEFIKFDVSTIKKLYRVAYFRDDYEILAKISTIHFSREGSNRGYSLYLKRRDLRNLKRLVKFSPEDYIAYSKEILLSLNGYERSFAPFTRVQSNYDWNSYSLIVNKYHFDEFAYHTTAFYIINGDSPNHTINRNKRFFVNIDGSESNHLSPPNIELWKDNFNVLLEILKRSEVEIVQRFAFTTLCSDKESLKSLDIESMIPLLRLKNSEARKFFFDILKEIFAESENEKILKGFILSGDEEIIEYGVELSRTREYIFSESAFLIDIIEDGVKGFFDEIIEIAPNEIEEDIIDRVVEITLKQKLPLNQGIKDRVMKSFRKYIKYLKLHHIERMIIPNSTNDFALIGVELIRESDIEIPLSLKEHIAQFQHPQMVATMIFLLGKMSNDILIKEHKVLVHFLFYSKRLVRKEAQKLIERLSSSNSQFAKTVLEDIAQNSFSSVDRDVEEDLIKSLDLLKSAYRDFPSDTLYRLIVAKSKVANLVGSKILQAFEYDRFSITQWVTFSKNRNVAVRKWAFEAFRSSPKKVKDALPKPLEIFDTNWEDSRKFAIEYFANFDLSLDEIVLIADSNYFDVQLFAKNLIMKRGLKGGRLAQRLSQHPSQLIQRFVIETILESLEDDDFLKLEEFFHKVLLSVNSNRVAKILIVKTLNSKLENPKIASLYARLAKRHYRSMVRSDRESFISAMYEIKKRYPEISLPVEIIDEVEVKSAV